MPDSSLRGRPIWWLQQPLLGQSLVWRENGSALLTRASHGTLPPTHFSLGGKGMGSESDTYHQVLD